MLSFDNIQEQIKLSVKEQIEKIGELDIYFKYLHYFPQPNKSYKSPFARDSTPSLRFRLDKSLNFKCFSSGKGGSCVQLVADLYSESYKQALIRIFNDFKTSSNVHSTPKIKTTDLFVRYDTEIQVELQSFNKADLDYWLQGNIDKKTLDFFDVKVAEKVWLDKGEGLKYIWNYTPKNPIFRYLVNGRYKCYKPLEPDKQYKWLGNMTSKDWQGFKQLPKTSKTLIITKSMKDIMVWYKMGYSATSPSSESQVIKPEVIKYFYTRFDNIYINYDFDDAGIFQSGKYDLPKIFTFDPNAKDVFDLTRKIGFEQAKTILLKQIK